MNGGKGPVESTLLGTRVPKSKHGDAATPQEVPEAGAVLEEKWAPTWRASSRRARGRWAGEAAPWGAESRSGRAGAPVFEQQDPEQLLSVLRPDLLLVDEPIQQLVGHSCQGGLRQVQEDGPCRPRRGQPVGRIAALPSQQASQAP